MTLAGSLAMAKIRIIGTALGCIAGMAVQLILGSWYGHGLLFCNKLLQTFNELVEVFSQFTNFVTVFYFDALSQVDTLLEAAGISELFEGVVSADDIKTFKPNPGVYSHFLRQAHSTGANTWLISSNPFDVIAIRCLMNT